jgi:hypothetical protein
LGQRLFETQQRMSCDIEKADGYGKTPQPAQAA